jgi:hypothetical protein
MVGLPEMTFAAAELAVQSRNRHRRVLRTNRGLETRRYDPSDLTVRLIRKLGNAINCAAGRNRVAGAFNHLTPILGDTGPAVLRHGGGALERSHHGIFGTRARNGSRR